MKHVAPPPRGVGLVLFFLFPARTRSPNIIRRPTHRDKPAAAAKINRERDKPQKPSLVDILRERVLSLSGFRSLFLGRIGSGERRLSHFSRTTVHLLYARIE